MLTAEDKEVIKDFRAGYYDHVVSVEDKDNESLVHAFFRMRVLFQRKNVETAKKVFLKIKPLLLERVAMGDALALYMIGYCHISENDFFPDTDESEGWNLLERSAQCGCPLALNVMGWEYTIGKRFEKNLDKAFEYLSKAHELGDIVGTYRLGILFLTGQGCERDLVKSFECFDMAAKKDYPPALGQLGKAYFFGTGVEKDEGRAYELFKKSVESWQRDNMRIWANGYYWLGVLNQEGRGVERDGKSAYCYFRLAETRGVKAAKRRLFELLKTGDGVRKDREMAWIWFVQAYEESDKVVLKMAIDMLTSDVSCEKYNLKLLQVKVDGKQNDVFEIARQGAESGNPEVQFELYKCYRDGVGTEKDVSQADRWLQQAADGGCAAALVELADNMYGTEGKEKMEKVPEAAIELYAKAAAQEDERGKRLYAISCKVNGVIALMSEENKKALGWFKRAVRFGDPGAMYEYGKLYEKGEIVSRDMDEAEFWYHRSSNLGYPPAEYAMSRMYSEGTGIVKDEGMADLLLRKSATDGYVEAQRFLGMCYCLGICGIVRDARLAFAWLLKAALQDDLLAVFMVGAAYESGEGVEADQREKDRWWKRLRELGTTPEKMMESFQHVATEFKKWSASGGRD